MPILNLQRRIREVGRIRMGDQTTTSNGRNRPRKLETFRLSSPDQTVIDAVAHVYGGTVQAWNNNGASQWEVFTDADQLRIALPPNPADLGWSQYYEQWAKAFCTHRCDGERETINDRPCVCDPESRDCKPTSRLSVFLPDIVGLGVWRLETHGYYAAVELAGAIEIIEAMAGARSIVPARLRLDQREVRRLIAGKAEVRKFAVPVIDLDVSIMAVRSLTVTNPPVELADPEGSNEGWQPIPPVEAPVALSIESQLKEIETPKPAKARKNAAAPLPATGRAPRTAAQAGGQTCDLCDQPYGADALVKNPVQLEGCSRFVHKKCLADNEPTPEPARTPAAKSRPAPTGPEMTHGQHKKIMAMTAELFPVDVTKVSGPEADKFRRHVTLTMIAQLTGEVLNSRTEIDRQTAIVLIDALEQLEAGHLVWNADREELVDRSGQRVSFQVGPA